MLDQLYKWWFYSLGLFLLSFFTASDIQALLLIPVTSVSLGIISIDYKRFVKHMPSSLALSMFGIFTFILIGALLSDHQSEAWIVLSQNLTYLVLPLVLLPIQFVNAKQENQLFWTYQIGLSSIGIICLANAALTHYELGSAFIHPGATLYLYNVYYSHLLTDPLGIQPVYYSFFITLGGISLSRYMLTSARPLTDKLKGIVLIQFVFQLLLIYLLKSVLFSALYILCISAVLLTTRWNWMKQKKQRLALSLFVLCSLLVAAGFLAKPKLEKFSLQYDLSEIHLTPIQMRLAIWECSLELISENPIMGSGTGDQAEELFRKYEDKGFTIPIISQTRYNTHNQYLQFWLAYGIGALLVFIYLIIASLYKSVSVRNPTFFLFVFCVAIFSINESSLQTQRGLFFALTFFSLFWHKSDFWNFNSIAERTS